MMITPLLISCHSDFRVTALNIRANKVNGDARSPQRGRLYAKSQPTDRQISGGMKQKEVMP
jgi:hypothetical protein